MVDYSQLHVRVFNVWTGSCTSLAEVDGTMIVPEWVGMIKTELIDWDGMRMGNGGADLQGYLVCIIKSS